MGSLLDKFGVCEMCKKPISGSELCMECNKKKKKAQEHALATDATSTEISEMFGISERLIEKWIRKGEFWCKAPCRSCGKEVKGGNICDECRLRFFTELKRD